MIKPQTIKKTLLFVCLAAILFYIIRASLAEGDFIGYINAGYLSLNGLDIYGDYLNTWPPFFSVFCVPLYFLDSISSIGVRILWLLISVAAMFWSMRITVGWLHNKKLQLPFQKELPKSIAFSNALVFIPFLILFRFLLDNLANVQINVLLLWASLLVVDYFIKGKDLLAGGILAFVISLKVIPVFLLLYFGFKRAYGLVAWTFVFLLLFNGISLIVFGFDQGLSYYSYWWNEIASQTNLILHKNQSIFSMLASLMINESQGLGVHLNLLDLPLESFKRVAYILLFLLALYPMHQFREKVKNRKESLLQLEYVFILTAIPILSPLSWKAYFIFLWPGYLYSYYYLYHHTGESNFKMKKVLKVLFLLSVILTVFTTDLFLGAYLADLMEVFSTITVGTILLLIIILIIHKSEKMNILKSKSDYR